MPVARRQVYRAATVVLGGQNLIALDYMTHTFAVSALVDIVSGTASYTVEYTMDDVTGITSPTGTADLAAIRWHELPDFPSPQTATKLGTIAFPCTGIRLNIGSMTGEIRFSVVQGIS